jgi:hypothetical protein
MSGNPINDWIDARIKVAMDELHKDLQEDIAGVEARLTARLLSLPGLLGDQIQNVAVDAGALAGKIVAAVNGQLAGFPQQIIQGVLGGIPNVFNPFKGGR